jgi:hypothetical protein
MSYRIKLWTGSAIGGTGDNSPTYGPKPTLEVQGHFSRSSPELSAASPHLAPDGGTTTSISFYREAGSMAVEQLKLNGLDSNESARRAVDCARKLRDSVGSKPLSFIFCGWETNHASRITNLLSALNKTLRHYFSTSCIFHLRGGIVKSQARLPDWAKSGHHGENPERVIVSAIGISSITAAESQLVGERVDWICPVQVTGSVGNRLYEFNGVPALRWLDSVTDAEKETLFLVSRPCRDGPGQLAVTWYSLVGWEPGSGALSVVPGHCAEGTVLDLFATTPASTA